MKFASGKSSMETLLTQDWRAAIRRTSILVCGTLFLGSAQSALAAPNDRPSMREFRDMHGDLSRKEARLLFKDTYNARSAVGAELTPRIEAKQARIEAAILRHNAVVPNTDTIKRGLQGKLERLGVQQIGSNLVRLNSGVDLDLTSADRNIVLGSNLFKNSLGSVEINVGGTTQTYSAGAKVTAAEYIAVKQALSGSGQKLILDASGIANGGTLDLTAISGNNDPLRAANLTISSGVTTYGDFGKGSDFILKGDLNNYGSIYALSSRNNSRGGAIRADDITNQSGALISSVLPSTLTGTYSPKVDLELNARGELTNHGTIESSGNLTLVSQSVPTIASSVPASDSKITNSGTISAQDSVTLFGSTINNSGTIGAVNGNIFIDGSATQDINVKNAGGTLSALNGHITLRTPTYYGTSGINITGGDLLSKELIMNGGNGTNNVNVNKLTGVVSQSALAGHIIAATDNLQIGSTCLTGDPTFYNNGGDITISSSIAAGEVLTFIATGNIFSNPGTVIEARNASGGFEINMIAGANIISPAAGSSLPPTASTSPVTFDGASAGGGSIFLQGSTINTTPIGTTGNGGNVNLFAFKGAGSTTGWIDVNTTSINTGGQGSGSNGNVTIIAGGANPIPAQHILFGTTAIQIGAMDTSGGTGGGGNLFVSTSQPTITGGTTVTYKTDGTLDTTGGNLIASTVTTGASIGFAGGVTRIGGDVTLAAGKDIIQEYDGFEPTSTLFMTKVDATIDMTAAGGNIGADFDAPFVIQGFNKPFTKSVAKKNPNGTTNLILNATGNAYIVRQMSTDLELNTSTVGQNLNLYSNSKLTVDGTVTSMTGNVRLENQGGNFVLANNADIIAETAIAITNGSKKNLKPTIFLGTNSNLQTTTTTPSTGPGGIGIIDLTLDQKAFKGMDRPGLQGRRSRSPMLSAIGTSRETEWITDLVVVTENSGRVMYFGKVPDAAAAGPQNFFTTNGADIYVINGGKKGSIFFNGGVTMTTAQ